MIFKRGQPGFRDAVEDFRRGYVDSHYPNLTGYAFQADMIEEAEGRKIMRRMLRSIVEIETNGVYGHPEIKLKGERDWRSVVSTDDFPIPTDEPWDEPQEEEEAEEAPRRPRTLFNGRRR